MKLKKWIVALTALAVIWTSADRVSAQAIQDKAFKLTLPRSNDDLSNIIVYSDSFADNGNIYKLFGFPGPPYWNGRWSNGPVAIETTAAVLRLPLLDYAYAAATTGLGDLIDGGTPEQLGSLGVPGITTAYNTTIGSIPWRTIRHSLFVVYGGLPDFMSDGLTTATADHAVADLVAIVTDLQKRGAKRILVPGLLDMGMTPNYASQGPVIAAQATSISSYMNQKLVATLPKGVMYFDTYNLYHAMRDYPRAFGLNDVVDQCFNNGVVCANPDQYLFWDFVHPTEHVQLILAVGYALMVSEFDRSTLSQQPSDSSE